MKSEDVFHLNPLPTWIYDIENKEIIDVNEAAIKLYGYSKNEFLNLSLSDLRPETEIPILKATLKGIEKKEGKIELGVFIHKKKSGELIEVEIFINKITQDSKKIILIVCREINKKEKQFELLNKSKERLQLLESVIVNTSDAVLITEAIQLSEPGPRIIFVNEAFTKMTGYTSEEIIGKSPRILQGPNSDKKELAKLSKAIHNFEPCEITTINYKKNREEFWSNFTVTPVLNENNECSHFIAIQRDVTEQKQWELHKQLLSEISQCFGVENTLQNASKKVCETICKYASLDFAEIWLPNLEKTKIQLLTYFANGINAELFYQLSVNEKAFDINNGFPGMVFQNKSSLLLQNVSEKTEFIRKEASKKSGINTLLGIPLLFNNEVLAVFILGTKHEADFLNKYTKIFEQLKDFIGYEINRKKLEHDVNHLYDSIPDLICVTDLNGKFLKINRAGCEMIGYNEEEILNYTFEKFIHPDDIEISNTDLEKLHQGKKTTNFENRYITKSGKVIWLSWTSITDFEEQHIYASAKNITTEKSLRKLTAQASKLAKIGSWEVNLLTNTIYWSDYTHEIHDTDPKLFTPNLEMGINFYREDFRPLVIENVTKCIEFGTPFDFQAIIIKAKNKERWVRSIASAEMIQGKCHRIYGSFQDIHEQKIAEINLQKSLKDLVDYKFALDQTASISWSDADGVITAINDNFSKLSKYSKEELVGKNHRVLNSNYHPKEFFSSLWCTIKLGNVFRGEVKNKAKDGTYFWTDTTIVPFLDENNIPYQYLAMRVDITDRKLAEERFLKTLEDKNTILESIGDAFFTLDTNWIVTYWNNNAEKLIGIERKNIVGKKLWNEYPETMNTSFYKQAYKAMECQENINFEEYFAKHEKWYEVSVYPTNEVLSVYFKDITHRKEAILSIEKANERFENVTKATNDAIYDWDIANDTHFWGEGFETILGYDLTKEQPTSDAWLNQIHKEDFDRVKKSIFKAIEDPTIFKWQEQYRFIKKNGSIAYLIDKGIIIRDQHLNPIRMVGAITDLTQQKSQELELISLNNSLQKYTKELETTNNQLEQFAYIASHDLQEPLRMITSFMGLLKRKYEFQLDEKGNQYINFATDGAIRMKKIILDLLDYSRAGKINENRETFAVNDIIEEYKFLRNQLIVEKNAEIIVTKMPVIQCYKSPFIQTLHGLIDNAIKYSLKNIAPKVHIFAEENDDHFKISIQDNGIGIEPKYHEKIFVIFQRLHNKETYEGTGIGLAIAKKQVESWGGEIGVTSDIGKGATFYFTIPK